MQKQLYPLPPTTKITHPDKPIWPKSGIQKDDYLMYLQRIAPYMLPLLKDRLLTVIRFPHGVPGESFYQKIVQIMFLILLRQRKWTILTILCAMI